MGGCVGADARVSGLRDQCGIRPHGCARAAALREETGSDPIDHRQFRAARAIRLPLPRVAVTASLAVPRWRRRRRNQIDDRQPEPRRHAGAPAVRAVRDDARTAWPAVRRLPTSLRACFRDEESVEAGDLEEVFRRRSRAYLALCAQPACRQALDAGERALRGAFLGAARGAQTILRGTFDCLVKRRDGGVTVLELKTGKPAPEHEQQLSTYLTAARALFPGTPVEGKLVYARRSDLDHRPLDPKR